MHHEPTGHSHDPHEPVLDELDEAEILRLMGPDPLSYWEFDTNSTTVNRTHGDLMIVHAASMSLAFFGALPVGIVLRAFNNPLHCVVQTIFVILVVLGWLTGFIYNKLTPSLFSFHRYPGEKHSASGYVTLLLVAAIASRDVIGVLGRIWTFFRSDDSFSFNTFWSQIIRGKPHPFSVHSPSTLYTPFEDSPELNRLVEEPDTYESELASPHDASSPRRAHFADIDLFKNTGPAQSSVHEKAQRETNISLYGPSTRASYSHRSHHSEQSTSSTLHEDVPVCEFSPHHTGMRAGTFDGCDEEDDDLDAELQKGRSKWSKLISMTVYVTEWILVALGFAQLLSGVAVYSGICHGGYLNGCLAHFIKGGVFFIYGILTFCRYLGAFAKYGWAWNRVTTTSRHFGGPTAEMVESTVIFTYGITNTWLERTGAKPGAPYSTKEIQHIGIALMFWFAGLAGMALESRRVRRLLSLSAFSDGSLALRTEPTSYTGSFNPFPAIVIGVTGAAMAAHHQRYMFAVQVHALWGNLLLAFSVLRCVTYVFLWLRPPTSERSLLPSRPPSELLASFFLASGGLVFISSSEPIIFGAMRHGRDDLMMILDVVVAITCFVFTWCVVVLAIKGWARNRAALLMAAKMEPSGPRSIRA
ncbi:uncharacterized protein EI90DRAFT_2934701 [Cantharellus anzutake]|uniref:uncharacterized protein n=1 Tax=Cantharellus anzutake TaxID=1750568 RepID=UPI0019080790|nr:uncharacterized protein EI90DRAFT_2934701 [Cantharellus anzutake]KAF8324437.1 hypothetical protein EI90DRAFT_2934701 [Cantharellus anzutake]